MSGLQHVGLVSIFLLVPVLACRELVTAGNDATKIGEVLPDPGAARDPVEMQYYAQIAGDGRAGI